MAETNKTRKNRLKTALAALLIICIGALIGIVFTPIFDVQEVYCEGNSRVSTETLTEAAQIGVGKNIIFQRLSSIEKKIKEIPEIDDVNVKRVFPNKIKIQVKERIPAGYFLADNKCIAIDLERRVLNISEGDAATGIAEYLTPEKLEGRPEEEPKEENPENKKDGEGEEQTENFDVQENPESTEPPSVNEEETPEEETAGEENTEETAEVINIPYEIPLIVGIEIKSADIGKVIQSKEADKLDKIMTTLIGLEKVGLLKRTTYFDATNINDIIIVIEKRLEVQLGNLDNIEYRCSFLAKIINEKISATEHAVLDYRNEDVYVRQPDDGKERAIPKPTPTPEPAEEPEKEENKSENGNGDGENPSATATRSANELEE